MSARQAFPLHAVLSERLMQRNDEAQPKQRLIDAGKIAARSFPC
jgi:hypothetical protein